MGLRAFVTFAWHKHWVNAQVLGEGEEQATRHTVHVPQIFLELQNIKLFIFANYILAFLTLRCA